MPSNHLRWILKHILVEEGYISSYKKMNGRFIYICNYWRKQITELDHKTKIINLTSQLSLHFEKCDEIKNKALREQLLSLFSKITDIFGVLNRHKTASQSKSSSSSRRFSISTQSQTYSNMNNNESSSSSSSLKK